MTPAVRGNPPPFAPARHKLGFSPHCGVQTTVSTDVLIDLNNTMNCPDNLFLLQLYININSLDRNVQKQSKTMDANWKCHVTSVTAHIVAVHILSPATIYIDPHGTYCRRLAHIVAGDNMCRDWRYFQTSSLATICAVNVSIYCRRGRCVKVFEYVPPLSLSLSLSYCFFLTCGF